MNIGVIGCGRISERYLQVMTEKLQNVLTVAACADLRRENAEAKAVKFGIPSVLTPDELIASPEVEAVMNLTNPWAHLEVGMAVLEAGKHLYAEKPLGLTRQEGATLRAKATEQGLRIGCAPDTVLGAGIQTSRRVLDEGWIGSPLFVEASIVMPINNRQYTSAGVGGVLLDMGPYYISALIQLLGSIATVAGSVRTPTPAKKAWDTREGEYGRTFQADSHTVAASVLEFSSGLLGTFTATSDGHGYVPSIRVVGTDGVLTVPDPNTFGGEIAVTRRGAEPTSFPFRFGYSENSRGLGLAEMARAIVGGRPHRANDEVAYHVLDTLLAIGDSSETGAKVTLESTCTRPEPMPDLTVNDPLFV